MKATLLCPGPSLAGYDPERHRSGWTVGVNRVVGAFECDVWSACDRPLIDSVTPLGTPALLTINATQDALRRKGRPWPHLVITHCGMLGGDSPCNVRQPWTRYSATAALFYLKWIGAERIDVYGVDRRGVLDWDGVKGGCGRNSNRWKDEAKIWDELVASMDVEVIRHGTT